MNDITLSICIATLNRAYTLKQTLESIIIQADDEIEIVIVDGNSKDNTEQVATECKTRFNHLNYFRQSENGGIDRDYSKAIDLAHGEYCWFMSDDDILKLGAISTILKHIKSKYDLIIVNTESRTIDLKRVLVKQNTFLKSNRLYTPDDYEALFVDTARHLSYIPAVIVKRKIWQDRDKESYWGSLFAHVGVIFQKPLSGNALFIAEPLISVRRGNVSWGSKAFEVWLFKWPDLIWSFPLFSDSSKQKVTKKAPWEKLTVLVKFRGSCCYFPKDYERWLASSHKDKWFKAAAKAISMLPFLIISPILIAYLFLFERDSNGSIYEIIMDPHFRNSFRFLIKDHLDLKGEL